MTSSYPSKHWADDVIDTRDLVEEAAQLELSEDQEDLDKASDLRILMARIEEYSGDKCTDGVTLIRETHFEHYARELHDDTCECASTPRDSFGRPRRGEEQPMIERWPHRHIDWAAAADELRDDYTEIDWAEITYLYC